MAQEKILLSSRPIRTLPAALRRMPRWGWTALVVVAAATLAGITLRRALFGSNDMDVFYKAGLYLWKHGQLDAESDIIRYPPTFHAILAVFGWMPYWLAATIKSILSIILAADIPRRMEQLSGISPRRQLPAWFVAGPFLLSNIMIGQNGAFLLWLAVAGLAFARRHRPILGGALIATAMCIKVLPGAFLAVPIVVGRRWNALVGMVAAPILLFGLLAIFTGWGGGAEAVAAWWRRGNAEYNPQTMIEEETALRENNQSLPITLARTLGPVDDLDIDGAVRLASWPLSVSWAIHKAIVGMVGLVVLALFVRVWLRPESERDWLGVFALPAIAMLTVSPIVWTFYFYWLLPGCVFLCRRPRLVWGFAAASLLILTNNYARGLGLNLFLGLVIFFLVARELWRGEAESAPVSRPADAQAGS